MITLTDFYISKALNAKLLHVVAYVHHSVVLKLYFSKGTQINSAEVLYLQYNFCYSTSITLNFREKYSAFYMTTFI